MEVRLPIQAAEGRGGWKLTSGEPPPPPVSRAWILFAPSLRLPFAVRLSSYWQSDLHLNFFVAPTLRRVDGTRKFTTGTREGGTMPEMAAFLLLPSTIAREKSRISTLANFHGVGIVVNFWSNSWFNKLSYNRIIRSLFARGAPLYHLISSFSILVVPHYYRVLLGA